jgi:hypothetical protein
MFDWTLTLTEVRVAPNKWKQLVVDLVTAVKDYQPV